MSTDLHLMNGRHTMTSENTTHVKQFQTFAEKNWIIYLFFSRGEYEYCHQIIKIELERSYNQNIFAHYIKAKIYKSELKLSEALEEFQFCHKLQPTDVKYIKNIAECLFILKRYRFALEAYIEAEHLSEKPDWQIFYNIGKCLLKLDAPDKGYEYVRRAAELSQQEEPFLLLNKLLNASKDYATSTVICRAALEHCPESIVLLNSLAISLIRLDQTDLAFECLGSALALDPQNKETLLAIGCIIQNHGDFDVALSKYRMAADQSTSFELWSNIGLCFYAKQKYVGAISCLLRSLWIAPLNWRVLYNLGLVYLSANQLASAFHCICASVNLNPDYANSFMLLGIALKLLDDQENAYKAFSRAVYMAPNDAIVILNFVVSCYDMKKTDETIQQLQHVKELVLKNSCDVNDECLQLLEKLVKVLPDELQVGSAPEEPEYAEIHATSTPQFDDPNEV